MAIGMFRISPISACRSSKMAAKFSSFWRSLSVTTATQYNYMQDTKVKNQTG
ncbi:hypothetical protein DPMN_078425 [Dreissena polymorpha]|uniref:Uncharacterized protein n=1 Tax=Dreissena polymorpha TaxID=45954 RepID=A0A9D3YR61_DREPO|nr:hypothetical protein DPMN_078425 [Dreissena polymorpha]